ncbi:hypothetical protein EsH8_VI_000985 [Colletotrichum jinshuiense]
MSIGSAVITGAVVFLGYFWVGAMRATDGEIVHPQFWNLIVFSDWASRAVTITAAVLRVCLAFQMGVFTAMLASLMIERAGVPLMSAPLISMLRAVSASPYNLVNWTTFTMPWRSSLIYTIAIAISVLLTAASQFSSTVLLSDFTTVNVTVPWEFASILYGRSGQNDDILEGSRIWNSQPWTYFRFAEHPRIPTGDQLSDRYEDTGHILRAFLPFMSESSRSRLRRYEGPAAVIDSRVVCVRPVIEDVVFSISASDIDPHLDHYREYFVRGTFGFGGEFDEIPINDVTSRTEWPFHCVVSAEGSYKDDWDLSICSAHGGKLQAAGPVYQGMPVLSSLLSGTSTSIFLMFNGTGAVETWRPIIRNFGNISSDSSRWEASAQNWTASIDEIWARIDVPGTNNSMSVSACFANLGGHVLNVSISGDTNSIEPSLVWDKTTARFNTDVIRNQYSTPGYYNLSVESRGILSLASKDTWENEPVKIDYGRVLLTSVDSSLPFMNRGAFDPDLDPSPCGTLRTGPTGGDSSRALHYAHSALFQDVLKRGGNLSEALQAVLMVTQQMEYYETIPYFQEAWPASYVMAEEKLLPVRWLGFGIVIGIIGVHFLLVAITMTFFLKLTRSSWLGNVWMALSQIVSVETEDIILKSTHRDDEEVECLISEATTGVDARLRQRVKIKKNEINERDELVSF